MSNADRLAALADRQSPRGAPPCIFTVDVEDWFHILDLSTVSDPEGWDAFPSRVETNFLRLLDLIEEGGARATCFFLGWVARRFPELVRTAVRRGHEAASHGYAHRLAYSMTPDEFYRDALQARQVIEDAAGLPVAGYRAPGFSLTTATPWFFEKLAEAGYVYDSSLFPARRNHGGCAGAQLGPSRVTTAAGELIEFPVSVVPIWGTRLCLFGGGYFRLFPLPLITRMADRVLASGRPLVFYLHPREIDPAQPRLEMPLARRARCYLNLASTERKLRALLGRYSFTSFTAWMERAGWMPALTPWACK